MPLSNLKTSSTFHICSPQDMKGITVRTILPRIPTPTVDTMPPPSTHPLPGTWAQDQAGTRQATVTRLSQVRRWALSILLRLRVHQWALSIPLRHRPRRRVLSNTRQVAVAQFTLVRRWVLRITRLGSIRN